METGTSLARRELTAEINTGLAWWELIAGIGTGVESKALLSRIRLTGILARGLINKIKFYRYISVESY